MHRTESRCGGKNYEKRSSCHAEQWNAHQDCLPLFLLSLAQIIIDNNDIFQVYSFHQGQGDHDTTTTNQTGKGKLQQYQQQCCREKGIGKQHHRRRRRRKHRKRQFLILATSAADQKTAQIRRVVVNLLRRQIRRAAPPPPLPKGRPPILGSRGSKAGIHPRHPRLPRRGQVRPHPDHRPRGGGRHAARDHRLDERPGRSVPGVRTHDAGEDRGEELHDEHGEGDRSGGVYEERVFEREGISVEFAGGYSVGFFGGGGGEVVAGFGGGRCRWR
mmetsp:Transcript_14242/g.30419  ORF Transcript_14242/g.30419 Transcript_14242/m.30419 type:complete len:273 (-) Transcript_14242:250-1068(-)